MIDVVKYYRDVLEFIWVDDITKDEPILLIYESCVCGLV